MRPPGVTPWRDRSASRLPDQRHDAAGQSPQEAAETLYVTVKTVHAHKTVILSECRNAWELLEDARLDYHFLREKFGRYFQAL